MNRLKGTALATGVLMVAWLLAASDLAAPTRQMNDSEAAMQRGGAVCAGATFNTTNICRFREFYNNDDGFWYRCDGDSLDQDCQAAQANTNNICSYGEATCSGAQQWWNDETGEWVLTPNNCAIPTYQTATPQQGACRVAGGGG